MIGIIEMGAGLLTAANRRAEVAGQNIANATTPSYKSRISFQKMMDPADSELDSASTRPDAFDWAQGKIVPTRNPTDLAISGNGFFAVRSGERILYTRNGQFHRDADGRLVTASGLVLQASGGDAILSNADFKVTPDGTIVDGDKQSDQIMLVDFKDRSALKATDAGAYDAPADQAYEIAAPHILQGSLEQSNISTATEMLSMMSAVRSAESGQRIVQLYDELTAEAANGFTRGQG